MYLFSVAAKKVLPNSDAYFGISLHFLPDRWAVRFLCFLQRQTQQRHASSLGVGLDIRYAVFAHLQV
jgi:hypothetical protein